MTPVPPDPVTQVGLTPGSATALVRRHAALLVDTDVADPIVRALQGATTIDDVDATLRMLWHRSKRGLRGFAYATRRGDAHVLLVGGSAQATIIDVAGTADIVSSEGRRTWVERTVTERATIVLARSGDVAPLGDHFIEHGIVSADSLTIFRWDA